MSCDLFMRKSACREAVDDRSQLSYHEQKYLMRSRESLPHSQFDLYHPVLKL